MNEQHPTFLFLCGVGRSGTTALRTSLGSHPQIYYNGFENNIIQDIVGVALRNCTMPSRKKSMATDQAEYDRCFRELICKLVWPKRDIALRPIHLAAINPTPAQLDYIQSLFPRSKFIGLIRNGIEVISSRREYRSFARDVFVSHCEVWNRSFDIFEWGQKNVNAFRAIRHEWMYQPAELGQCMKGFFEWLSIEHSVVPEQQILGTLRHPTSAGVSLKLADFRKSAIDKRQQYFQSKRERWRSWTPQQRAMFEDLCGENMFALGYDIPWKSNNVNSRMAG